MVEIIMNKIDIKLDASAIIKEILLKRGISSDEETSEFLSDKPKLTYDPFLLKDMDKSVDAILLAIQLKKNICIYGDYDSDGVTAICLLYEFLGTLTDKISYYIPSRFDEGYGLNIAAIKKLALKGCELLLTVDCGSISYEEVEFGKKLGLEIIVTDHHNINSKPADCLLINPKQEACNYPFKDLSGCGVAFKLAQGIQRKLNLEKSSVNSLLDLVAIATIGDIVPLVEENRTLVKYGISSINEGKRKGLRHLAEACNISEDRIKSEQIAFSIVPHINAAGRMHFAETAVRLLISDGENDIIEQSDKLLNYNIDRKKIQEDIYVKCIEILKLKGEIPKFIVVNSGDSHEGILGIVAGKIKERYKRPTIIVCNTAEKGVLKGTGRGTEGVDLYRMLDENQDLIIKYGGHKGACGFLIEESNLERLSENLNNAMIILDQENINSLDNEREYDYDITLESIDFNLLNMLEKLEPYGYKNEKPIFLIKNVRIKSINFMGTKAQHARFFVTDGKFTLECLLFNFSEKDKSLLIEGQNIQLIGYLDINCWNGNKKIQFMAKEIKPNN
jgi:single-stranded-DNA-specific exonuclease